MNYIGSGIGFPIILDDKGSPQILTGVQLVNSSIKMILGWPRHHRIFLSLFGGDITNLLEEPNDQLMIGIAEHIVADSLRKWEKRITMLDVSISRTKAEQLQIEILYKLNNKNISVSFTYPFYQLNSTVLIN